MDVKDVATNITNITANEDQAYEPHDPVSEPEVIEKHSRKRSITIFVIVSLINVALLVLLWTQLLTPRSDLSQSNSDTSTLGDVSSPLVGKSAPDFTLSNLNSSGGKVSLASFKGKSVVVNFWLSSCQPCQAEAPFLQQSAAKLQAKGVTLIGIDGQESVNDARQFLQKYGVTYTNVQDTVDGTTGINYGITGNPETFFINKNGIVVARWIGELNDQGLQHELAKLQ